MCVCMSAHVYAGVGVSASERVITGLGVIAGMGVSVDVSEGMGVCVGVNVHLSACMWMRVFMCECVSTKRSLLNQDSWGKTCYTFP